VASEQTFGGTGYDLGTTFYDLVTTFAGLHDMGYRSPRAVHPPGAGPGRDDRRAVRG
jgi:hypothetical protein